MLEVACFKELLCQSWSVVRSDTVLEVDCCKELHCVRGGLL